MKVIFLDVDGVLNCTKTERQIHKMRFVDTRKMLRVREICERTGAKVVISSSWRDGALEDANPWDKHMWKALIDEFDRHRIPVIGMTPFAPDRWRGDEINMWLKLQEEPVKDFVIVDDIVCDLTRFVSVGRVVQTVDAWGLTKAKMEECIKILGETK